jgi:hypothetical protein
MAGLSERLSIWPLRSILFLSGLRRSGKHCEAPETAADLLIYRLKSWPELPSSSKTADIYRTLSVMSNRPVNRRWILNSSGLEAREVDALLRLLVDQDAVDITDATKYPA